MRRLLILSSVLGLLVLASCSRNSESVDTEPDVAITRIFGPLLASQQAPESGGAGSVGSGNDLSGLIRPGAGSITVPASNLYNPVTGQTEQNPLSIYVTASDALLVTSVELFQDGNSIGRRTKDEDGIAFNNPFIFPRPNSQSSVTLQGAQSGLLSTRLSAVATDSAGQTRESAPLELQVDGSLPDINVTVSGSGTTGPFTVVAETTDSESGITSFTSIPDDINPSGDNLTRNSPASFRGVFSQPGEYGFTLKAVNGVQVATMTAVSFVITEPVEPPTTPDNTPPAVTLTANPSFGSAPLSVIFTTAAQDDDDDTLTYNWDFGNGATASSGDTQSATYAVSGTYVTSVTVSDGINEPVTVETTVIVEDEDGGGGTAPSITSFTADNQDEVVSPGTEVTLAWSISGTVTKVTISSDSDTFDVTTDEDSQFTVSPNETTTYTITASGNEGVDTESITVAVDDGNGGGGGGPDTLVISSFTANPTTATSAQDVTLSWSIEGAATEITITPEGGASIDVAGDEDGQYIVNPNETTTYTLNAENDEGSADPKTVTVTVENGDGGNGDNDNGGVDAVNDNAKTARGKAVTIGVLVNDKPGVQALSIVAATSPQRGGTVEISRDSRTIVYTPPSGFTGEDTFRYTVRDEDGNSAGARVYIQVGS